MNKNITEIDSNMAIKPISEDDNVFWFSPNEEPFRLSGFNWFKTDKIYRRLPLSSYDNIEQMNPAINMLATNTAGGKINFCTNSTSLHIKVTLAAPSGMSGMTACGQSGFDCYISYNDESQFYFEGATAFNIHNTEYTATLFKDLESDQKQIELNFPLYNGVKSVLIGIDKEATLSAPREFKVKNPIVFYGTSITQGGCASRPGMAYTNIISRRLNANCINLGFSGNAFGEPQMANLICDINSPSCIIIDYEANGGTNGKLEATLQQFIEIIRSKHTTVPILVISRIPYQGEARYPEKLKRRKELRDFQKNTVLFFKNNGDKNIFFLDGSTLLGEDFHECTVDTIHPTDLGFMRMADHLTPIIKDLIY